MNNTFTKIDWNGVKLRSATLMVRAVNHKLRQRILEMINESERPLTVTDIYVKLRLDQSVASQHLAILRRAGIIYAEREGKFIYYKVNHDNIHKIQSAIAEFNHP